MTAATDPGQLRERYGPWAVVAGGSEGVGREFATQLADAGVHLVLLARKPEPLEETAAMCRERGVDVRTIAMDLTAPDAVARLTAVTDDLEVGLLIYNAGANTHSAEFLDGDLEAFGQVITLNITTQMALVQHYGRPMRDRGRGGILLIGSMAGYMGSTRHSVYGGVKAFGRIFAESVWVELRKQGVDVVELVLGVTRTPAMERVGLNFDAPGFHASDPADVARQGLASLGHGPVVIAEGNEEGARIRSAVDERAKLVAGADKRMRQLMEGSTQHGTEASK